MKNNNKINYSISDSQLEKKFDKHAGNFGVKERDMQKFREAIENHLNSDKLKVIVGKFRGQEVIHNYNESTGLNVLLTREGDFISGWKLNKDQINYLLTTGNLGGS